MAWLLLALLLFVMGLGQQTFERQNVSSRALGALLPWGIRTGEDGVNGEG